MQLLRFLKILAVSLHFGLDQFATTHSRLRWLRAPLRVLLFWRPLRRARGERLRMALETLGPIFVKFGQVLSTRRDLIPLDIADELARLQDRVPPFPPEQVQKIVRRVYADRESDVFAQFDPVAVASASVESSSASWYSQESRRATARRK